MGLRSRAILAGGLGFTAAFVVACGGSNGLLSSEQASTLSNRLDALSQAVNAGNCSAATNAANAFNAAVGDLPPAVSTKLVQNLGDGAQTVKLLAARDCLSSSSSSSSSTASTSTTSTQPTSTTTTTVTNTPTTNSSTQTQQTTATNPAPPGTSTTTNGGASLGGTGTSGNGGNGQ
jgi:hypothetical protein